MIREYLNQIAHKLWALWGSALLTVAGIVTNYLFDEPVPWFVWFGIFIVGVFIAGYQVFRDTARERNKLLQDSPQIEIGFEQEGKIIDSIVININDPIEPQYDDEVEKKKIGLLSQYQQCKSEMKLSIMGILGTSLNSNFSEELTAYLDEYRDYLKELYEYFLIKQRMLQIYLVTKNTGTIPADDVAIELKLPTQLSIASPEQIAHVECNDPTPPKEPEIQHNLLSFNPFSYPSNTLHIPNITPNDMSTLIVQGPNYREEDPSIVMYRLQRLIPNLLEREFYPFQIWAGELKHSTILNIRTTIYAAQLPKPINQDIKLDIRLNELNNDRN
ncbi:MAG: hypothetical protein ACOWWR_04590 [Eubacteriales bacterium]